MDWKSFVPSITTTRASGEFISIRCSTPTRPFRPGLYGSSHAVRRPLRQSSMTRTCWPAVSRSEERRVGKECRSRWSAYHYKKNKKNGEAAANVITIKKATQRQGCDRDEV